MNGTGATRADIDCVVIGSGPAGVFCSLALLEKGRRVTLIDVGIQPESEVQNLLEQLTRDETRQRALSELEHRGKTEKVNDQGIPMKLIYGSDYPYRMVDQLFSTHVEDCDVKGSFAQGGLSNIWGAAMLSYRDEDLVHWPFALSQLVPHYRKVLSEIPYAAREDDLARIFPLYGTPRGSIQPGLQIERLLEKTSAHQEILARSGIFAGRARVAVHVQDNNGSASCGCWYCGQCMTGCPDQLIFSTKDLLPTLKRFPGFDYKRGLALIQFHEKERQVELILKEIPSGTLFRKSCLRLYLGAGSLISSSLVIASMKMWDQLFTLKDSQYFITPVVRFRGTPQVRTSPSFSLSQAFLELVGASPSRHSVHLQIYGYSDYIARAVRAHLAGVKAILRPFLNPLWGRLLMAQGFLHSEDSPRIEMRVCPGTGSTRLLEISLRKIPCDRTLPIVHGTLDLLNSFKGALGGVFIKQATEITQPGRSFHIGGTFPMSNSGRAVYSTKDAPSSWSDLLGRPQGLSRVHLVDASCFPSIPASTITLSVMANSHRIGMESADLDPQNP